MMNFPPLPSALSKETYTYSLQTAMFGVKGMGMSGEAIEAQCGDESSINTGSSVLLTLQ